MKRVFASIAAVAVLAAAPAIAQTSAAMRAARAKPNGNPGTPATTARNFVADAASSDMYERQSSELILRNPAASPRIRDFARMMIADHTRTTDELRRAAESQRMHVPPNMRPQQAGSIRQLQVHRGMDQVRLYVQQQMNAHNMALATDTSYANHGDNAALRQVASMAIPIIRGHLDRIRQIDATMRH